MVADPLRVKVAGVDDPNPDSMAYPCTVHVCFLESRGGDQSPLRDRSDH